MKRELFVIGDNHQSIRDFMHDHGIVGEAFGVNVNRIGDSLIGIGFEFDFVVVPGATIDHADECMVFLNKRGRQVTLRQTLLQRYELFIGRHADRFKRQFDAVRRFLYSSRRVLLRRESHRDAINSSTANCFRGER